MIYFETYGCPSNKADTEAMKAFLEDRVCDDLERADIVVVNSCGVKGQTERKILRRISELCEKKRVIVTGCLPKITDRIDKRASLMGINVSDIVSVVGQVERGNRVEMVADRRENKVLYKRRFDLISIIPISEGCAGACTYCATRFARGSLHSFPKEDIAAIIRRALYAGSKEFHLTSQDTGCWGRDRKENLLHLMSAIEDLKGDFILRVGMMNPKNIQDIVDELAHAFTSPRVYKFLHLPIQSASEKILRDMGRGYRKEDAIEIVSAFRRKMPNLYFCTDIIVGFPTETEEDFDETLELVARLRPDKVNQTMYSARPKTVSSRMKDMPDRIKKDRSRRLFRLRMEIARQINEGYIGKTHSCFINECGKGRPMGRLINYKPVVADGHLGEKREVEIVDCTPTYLISK